MAWRRTETEEQDGDLGFGSVVAARARRRLLNPDGSFNVERHGLGWRSNLSLYHSLLTLSWPRFLALVVVLYLLANAALATIYVALGPNALLGVEAETLGGRWWECFFFSVQTFSTVGYGGMHPATRAANLVMTAESVLGLLSVALVTGLMFARFSRPMADVIFSKNAIVAPYRGITALMFRLANRRRNQLVELQARVTLVMNDPERPGKRSFHQLMLERHRVSFFPLAWTVVHPIDEESPLNRMTAHDLADAESEFLVMLTAFDETFSQTVHTRSSYRPHEVRWNARFSSMFVTTDDDAPLSIDVRKIDDLRDV